MKKTIALTLAASLSVVTLMVSCGGGDDVSSRTEGSGGSGGGDNLTSSALDRYLGKTSDLLSEEEAAKICGSPEGAKFEVGNLKGQMAQYNSVKYEWDGGRKQTIKAGSMEVEAPEDYRLMVGLPVEVESLGKVKSVAEMFAESHRTLTAEEAARAKEAMNEAFTKEAEKRGMKVGEQEENLAKSLSGGVLGAAQKAQYEKVEGLGDAAYWSVKDRRLNVRVGNRYIPITADISDEIAVCKKAAIETAKLVLD